MSETTFQITNSAQEVLFTHTFILDGAMGYYKMGVWMTLGMLAIFFTAHTAYRLWKLFCEYVDGKDIDRMDDSNLFECWFNTGTNPYGILVDYVVWLVLSVCCAFIWLLYWPVFLIKSLAIYMRTRREEAKRIMNTLSGESRY